MVNLCSPYFYINVVGDKIKKQTMKNCKKKNKKQIVNSTSHFFEKLRNRTSLWKAAFLIGYTECRTYSTCTILRCSIMLPFDLESFFWFPLSSCCLQGWKSIPTQDFAGLETLRSQCVVPLYKSTKSKKLNCHHLEIIGRCQSTTSYGLGSSVQDKTSGSWVKYPLQKHEMVK